MDNKRRKVGANYKRYSEDVLEKALVDIRQKKLSLREASRKYKICLGTLSHKINKKYSSKVGHPYIFSDQEENTFVSHILKVSEWGYPFVVNDIRNFIQTYLTKSGRKVDMFPKNMPSQKWTKAFIKRHSDQLTMRMSQNIKCARASVSAQTISNFFDNLRQSLQDLPATNIYNYDETNLSDNPGTKKSVFRRGVKYPERVMDSTKSCISIMFCGSASGDMLPAYVVYKSDHLWSTWTEGGPPKTRYNRSKSGWFDAYTFADWFESTFIPHIRKLPGDKLILGDNLASHFSETVLRLAEENNIKFCCFPPNATHLIQPLDVAFFAPLKKCWREILQEYKQQMKKQSQCLTKDAFPKLLTKLYKKLYKTCDLKSENLVSGFEKCGIYPFNPVKVLERLPDYSKNLEATDVEANVSSAVIDLLRDLRGCDKQRIIRKKKKIQVEAGKSISVEDLNGRAVNQDENQHYEETLQNEGKNDESDDESKLSEPDDDAEENQEESDYHDYEITPTVDKYYVIEFKVKNYKRHYVGKITEVVDANNVNVAFLRASKKIPCKFVWPQVSDNGIIPTSELKIPLSDPQLDRRSGLLFMQRELKSFQKTIQ